MVDGARKDPGPVPGVSVEVMPLMVSLVAVVGSLGDRWDGHDSPNYVGIIRFPPLEF